jgi:hypothetical protein
MVDLLEVAKVVESRGYRAEVRPVVKNGVEVTGFCIGKPGINIMATLYPEKMNLKDVTVDEAADILLDIALDNLPDEDYEVERILDWNYIAPRLRMCVRPKKEDGALAVGFLDLELYLRAEVDAPTSTDDAMASMVVTVELAKNWNKTYEEIFAQAKDNMKDKYAIRDMAGALSMCGFDKDLLDEIEVMPNMYVLSTRDSLYGASAITSDLVMSSVQHLMGGDFYILPSSIHEVIAIPADDRSSVDYLRSMVREVNITQVPPAEVLSYSVYLFKNGELQVL